MHTLILALEKERQADLSSRTDWSSHQVPGEPGLHRETLLQKTKKPTNLTTWTPAVKVSRTIDLYASGSRASHGELLALVNSKHLGCTRHLSFGDHSSFSPIKLPLSIPGGLRVSLRLKTGPCFTKMKISLILNHYDPLWCPWEVHLSFC